MKYEDLINLGIEFGVLSEEEEKELGEPDLTIEYSYEELEKYVNE